MAAGDPGVLKRNFSATAIETTLVNSISSAATGDTTTSVSVVSVSGYPAAPFTLIFAPDTNKEEVVTCISVVGTTLQVIRGQDQTQAVSHTAGTSVRHGVSGRDFKEEQTHIAARGYDVDSGILSNAGQTHVHGLEVNDGSVVGSTQAVTLTRKTLTTPTINGATISGAFTSTATITGGTVTAATITSSTVTSSTITSGTLGSNLAAGGFLVTGLGAPASDNDAARKVYVDSILGSATSASISAASAAVSATSAATSATSAANSATASASSASAAATSASSALTSQTAAATSATSAATSATAAATSATSAATSASSALTSQTAAATSATSAAASATAAATSATSAAASATAAASSAGTAATSAGQAATSATSAATSATSAAASATAAATSATSAAASATTASNSAATATTQATNAATSAASAATSATAAATSATSAAASATSAADSFDSFDDRYLGAKATAPTVDNDGNALLTGALYWNTAVNKMYVWSGSVWAEISSSADIIAYKYTVAGGATSVSGADDNSLTLTYIVGKEQVYINGVLQVRGSDYTATTGSSITGMAAMIAGDIVTVLAFTAFVVANTYTQAEADAKFVQQTNNFFAGKNLINNGDMAIAQRGASTSSVTTTGYYSVDRFQNLISSMGTYTISQESDSPAGFNNSLKTLVTTADSAPAASSRTVIIQRQEGLALRRLAFGTASAKTTTMSFWVKSNVTGTYILELATTFSKSINASYTINTANTWEKKTITFAGDSNTAIATNTDTGIAVIWWLGAGTDYTSGTLPTSWATTVTANRAVGQVNFAAATNNYFQITGVQWEVGSFATDFQLSAGTIAGELAACQRYYFRVNGGAAYYPLTTGGFSNTTTTILAVTPFPSEMRIAPTALEQTGTAANYGINESGGGYTCSAVPGFNAATKTFGAVQFTVASGLTIGRGAWGRNDNNSTAYLAWSAEL
jgi:hypothetical protein